MAVMMPVAVVVAKYSAIIDSGDPRIDIGQAVPQYLCAPLDNFLFHNRPSPFTRQMTDVDGRCDQDGGSWFLPHQFMVSQVGHMMFALLLKPIFSWRMRRNFRGWPAHTPRRSDRALLQSVNR